MSCGADRGARILVGIGCVDPRILAGVSNEPRINEWIALRVRRKASDGPCEHQTESRRFDLSARIRMNGVRVFCFHVGRLRQETLRKREEHSISGFLTTTSTDVYLKQKR